MAEKYGVIFTKLGKNKYSLGPELFVVLDSKGKVLSSVYETDDSCETVYFEDIKNVFGIEIRDGNISFDNQLLAEYYLINTVLSANQIAANICGEENDEEVIDLIPLSKMEFLEGTSLQKAS